MYRICDLHVHPSLKMYYLPYLRNTFHAMTYAGKHWNPLSFRTRWGNLKKSPEKIMLCAHYVIERGFVAQGIHSVPRAFSWLTAPWFYGKLRFADPWKTLMRMMDALEKSEHNTNRWTSKNARKLRLVRSFADIELLADNEIALVHAVEGAHALGYGPSKGESLEQFWEKTQERLRVLKDRGVAMIGIAHFWDNYFAPQTDGTEIVPKKKNGEVTACKDDLIFRMKRADWNWDDRERLARQFAEKLCELGMLIDVSHMQPESRWKVYEICKKHGRPVVASHVGLRRFFDHEYNLSDQEIQTIHKMGGVVGLIFSRRWLVDPIQRWGTNGYGIDDLIENMVYIRKLTGDVSCIGVGTDFDGLTDPFKDCSTPDQMHNIAHAMKRHFSEEEIDAILYGNGRRALEKGWVASIT